MNAEVPPVTDLFTDIFCCRFKYVDKVMMRSASESWMKEKEKNGVSEFEFVRMCTFPFAPSEFSNC